MNLSDEQVEAARVLRAAGHPWSAIAKTLGVSWDRARSALDPVYAKRLKLRRADRSQRLYSDAGRPHRNQDEGSGPRLSGADVDQMRRRLPPDTRSPMAVLLGDPRPGRELMEVNGG